MGFDLLGIDEELLRHCYSFIMAYENVISDENTQSETRTKVTGLLKKSKNYNYITMTCLYLDILEKIVPDS